MISSAVFLCLIAEVTFKRGGSFLGQSFIKVEPNGVKWVVKFVQKRNLIHLYNQARESIH